MEFIYWVGMCRHDSDELCTICTRFIKPGQRYVRSESKITHYQCAKKRHWKRQSRVKVKAAPEKKAKQRVRVIKRLKVS